jgi:hypothetical protein
MATNLNISQLDFATIKNNLITYLSGQSQFQDYNFAGSNLNVLLDILAYNTFQNNFYTNMAFSEMFIDSAQLRESLISHAKELNYLPKSATSSHAIINVTLSVNDNPPFIVIPEKTQFIAKCGNQTFNFYNSTAVTLYQVNGLYTYNNLDVYEGKPVTEVFVADGDLYQKFVISNSNVDISSIKVKVQNSISDSTVNEYTFSSNIFGVASNDYVYYVQPSFDTKYELAFGQNVFGNQPVNGNLIFVEYRVTNGSIANGISSITPASNIQGYPATVQMVSTSFGGSDQESIESIRFFAPKSIQIQDRAVTQNDYEILLKNNFNEIKAVSVYGGELATPPQYGKVMVAVDVRNSNGVSLNNKQRYYSFLKSRCPVGIDPVILSPDFIYLSVKTDVKYSTKTTTNSASNVRVNVSNTIMNYSETNLSDFKSTFRYSKFIQAIDSSDPNIISNDTEVLAIIDINPILNVSSNFSVNFSNVLKPENSLTLGDSINDYDAAIKSSTFTYNNNIGYIQDDGLGNLHILQSNGSSFVYLKKNVGTVNYTTGQVIISNLNVSDYPGSAIKLYARTMTKDIDSPMNRIMTIRPEDVTITITGVSN